MYGSTLRCKKCNQYKPDRCTCVEWRSVAKWPKPEVNLGNADNSSTDTHRNKEAAQVVVDRLRFEGFGGEGKIFPLEVYCEPTTEGEVSDD